MNHDKLLTIAIPTYNRSAQLELLLDSIAKQYDSVKKHLRLVVVNNASTDNTEACCLKWKEQIDDLHYVANIENVGAVANVIKCFKLAATEYCWIIGDDDVVRYDVLGKIIALLIDCKPNLIYMLGIPFNDKPILEKMTFSEDLRIRHINALDFCRIVNIHTTFISSVIFNKSKFLDGRGVDECGLITDTLFPQLNWVLKIISSNEELLYIPQPLIQARAGNSGGYNLYKTFTIDLDNMVRHGLTPKMVGVYMGRVVLGYLPWLIMGVRRNEVGDFNVQLYERHYFRKIYWRYPLYWLIVEPILYFPLSVALFFLKLAYHLNRIQNLIYAVHVRFKIWAKSVASTRNGN